MELGYLISEIHGSFNNMDQYHNNFYFNINNPDTGIRINFSACRRFSDPSHFVDKPQKLLIAPIISTTLDYIKLNSETDNKNDKRQDGDGGDSDFVEANLSELAKTGLENNRKRRIYLKHFKSKKKKLNSHHNHLKVLDVDHDATTTTNHQYETNTNSTLEKYSSENTDDGEDDDDDCGGVNNCEFSDNDDDSNFEMNNMERSYTTNSDGNSNELSGRVDQSDTNELNSSTNRSNSSASHQRVIFEQVVESTLQSKSNNPLNDLSSIPPPPPPPLPLLPSLIESTPGSNTSSLSISLASSSLAAPSSSSSLLLSSLPTSSSSSSSSETITNNNNINTSNTDGSSGNNSSPSAINSEDVAAQIRKFDKSMLRPTASASDDTKSNNSSAATINVATSSSNLTSSDLFEQIKQFNKKSFRQVSKSLARSESTNKITEEPRSLTELLRKRMNVRYAAIQNDNNDDDDEDDGGDLKQNNAENSDWEK